MNWNDGLSRQLDMAGSSRMNLNAVSRLEEYDISETIRDQSICLSRRSHRVDEADFNL
jgi:hypothetical protein